MRAATSDRAPTDAPPGAPQCTTPPQPQRPRQPGSGRRGRVGSAPAGLVHPPGLPTGKTVHAQVRGGTPDAAPPPETEQAPKGARGTARTTTANRETATHP